MTTLLYRYDDYHDSEMPYVWLRSFKVLRDTPKGYWIEEWEGAGERYKKFVLKGAGKRFAYLSKDDAWDSFRRRKERQVNILAHQHDRVKRVLQQLGTLRADADKGKFSYVTMGDEEFLPC